MKTLVLEEPGRFAWREDASNGEPGPGEARVRIRRIGVCGTDLHAFRGRQPFFAYPRVLGHELAVEVDAVGPGVADGLVGRRCAVRPYINDEASRASRRGKTNCCPSMRVLGVHVDGGMRPSMSVPARLLHPVDEGTLGLDAVALVEPLAIGCHAVRRAAPTPTDRVLVIGAGPIGMAALQFARRSCESLTLLDLSEQRLAFCRDRLGVEDVAAVLAEDRRFDCVFDATGSPASMQKAFDYVDHGGRLTFVGLHTGDVVFHDPLFHAREMTLLASRNATADDFALVLASLADGSVDADAMVTRRLAFDDLDERFETLYDDAGLVKAVVEMPDA
ncbi:MAG: zinc-binding alcohol dehydrogenase family protein [Planctomycetota bacterium]